MASTAAQATAAAAACLEFFVVVYIDVVTTPDSFAASAVVALLTTPDSFAASAVVASASPVQDWSRWHHFHRR